MTHREVVGDGGLAGLQPELDLLLDENVAEQFDRLVLLGRELAAERVHRGQDAAVGEVDADPAVDLREHRHVVGRHIRLVVGLFATPMMRKALVEHAEQVGPLGQHPIVRRRSAGELALAALGRRVHAQQRQDVRRVVVHGQLGARFGAARRLHPVGQDLLLNAHHSVAERVVRHQIPEVGAERPVDALEVLDRMLLDGEAPHARQTLAEHQVPIEPREIVVEIGVARIGRRDLVAVLACGPAQNRFQRSDIAGRQVEREIFLARKSAPVQAIVSLTRSV